MMKDRRFYMAFGLIAALVLVAFGAGTAAGVIAPQAAVSAQAAPRTDLFTDEQLFGQEGEPQSPDNSTATLVLSYSVKYICTNALAGGTPWYNTYTPLVHQETDILIHNPQDFPVDVYIKATKQDGSPTMYGLHKLDMDQAMKMDCHVIYNLLGMGGEPPPGVDVTGFVVIQIGPQSVAGAVRHAVLDVTAEYVRGSEVLKKDIHFQPWWTWWPWALPWRLGYPYERLIPVSIITAPEQTNQLEINLDCNLMLHNELMKEVSQSSMDQVAKLETMNAISRGLEIYHDPLARNGLEPGGNPALVSLIGGCKKIMMTVNGYDSLYLDVDYVILSNKSPLEYAGPLSTEGGSSPSAILPPWIPGFWYDLPVVTPQNYSTDINGFFRQWHSLRWIEAGLTDVAIVNYNMQYFFPYWCGWGYWSWWWNAGSCTDIGVGEGESLDVEQITPVRVIMSSWPPVVLP
jgi:hypothetical protein